MRIDIKRGFMNIDTEGNFELKNSSEEDAFKMFVYETKRVADSIGMTPAEVAIIVDEFFKNHLIEKDEK